MGGSDEQFCLKWNDYHESMVATLQELRAHEDFVDVTLICDGAEIRAHRLILSACSDFFRHVLRRTPPAPAAPVIVLWDISAQDLRHILRYMYNGEVEVQQANLNNFLSVAERLRVRGLCQSGGNSSPIHPSSSSGAASSSTVPPPQAGMKRSGSLSPRSRSPSSHHSSSHHRRASMDHRAATPSKKSKFMPSSAPPPPPPDPEISIKEERGGPSNAAADKGDPSGADYGQGSEAEEYSEYGYGGNGRDDEDGAYPPEGGPSGHPSMPLMELWRRSTMATMARMGLGNVPGGMGGRGSDSNSPSYHDDRSHNSSGSGEPTRRQRSVYSSSQISQLEAFFAINEYIDGERKKQLSRLTNIPEQQIKVWFQNRRQKKKREMEDAIAKEQEREQLRERAREQRLAAEAAAASAAESGSDRLPMDL